MNNPKTTIAGYAGLLGTLLVLVAQVKPGSSWGQALTQIGHPTQWRRGQSGRDRSRRTEGINMRDVLLWVLCLGFSGCTGLASLAETLNTRQVTSCLWYQGAAGPYAQVTGVTATGGAKLDLCLETKRP